MNNMNTTDNINNIPNKDSMRQVRIARHLAFQKYISAQGYASADDDKIAPIIKEMTQYTINYQCTTSREENVLALQLSDAIEEFLATLSPQEHNIFIKRYFFMEDINTIADIYLLPETKVVNNLQHCLERFKAFTDKKGYIYSMETLFEGFTNLNDSFLKERTGKTFNHTNKTPKHIIIASIFATIILIVLIVIILSALISSSSDDKIIDEDSSSDMATDNYPVTLPLNQLSASDFLIDDVVDVDKLLLYAPEYTGITSMITIAYYDYILTYEQCELENNNILQYLIDGISLQELYGDNFLPDIYSSALDRSKWYQLEGHSDAQYLIQEIDGEYSLWKYKYLQCTELNTLTYKQPLRFIYDIYTSGDIKEILVYPSNKTNLDASPIDSIKNYEALDYIYYVMSNMICYGNSNWNIISGYPEHDFNEILEDSVRLDIVTPDGNVIDCFYYSDMAGCFYEYDNGIAYSKVSDNAKQELYEIFYKNKVGEKPFSTVLATHNIYSVGDISSIAISTIEDEHGQVTYEMITDATTIETIYNILSNMVSSAANNFEQTEPLYGSVVYEIVVFDSNGSGTEFLTFLGTFRGISAYGIAYNLTDEERSFLNQLGIDKLYQPTSE